MRPRLPRPCRLFLFDLDGTLIDSTMDIALSVNLALGSMSLPGIRPARIASFVGDGVRKLIERSLREVLGIDAQGPLLRDTMQRYLGEYERHLLDSTRLYPGVKDALDHLRWARLAVVTNKPERFSRRILDALGVGDRFCVILGGDSTAAGKPDPGPLRLAMERCGATAADTVMVGDSPVDIRAGKAAGVMTCGIAYEEAKGKQLEAAGCDLMIQEMTELLLHFRPARTLKNHGETESF